MFDPHGVTKQFERAIGDYTGAPFVVAVNSCTMAILLALAWKRKQFGKETVRLPKRTYVSVPQSVLHAGHDLQFDDREWIGEYQLIPFLIWDSARLFTSGMYRRGHMHCVSFHASKTLGIEQGGAILLDDPIADKWLRRARFDGRTEGVEPKHDSFDMVGWHCYMNPSTAAQGLLRLHSLPEHNEPMPNSEYPDLSTLPIFQS